MGIGWEEVEEEGREEGEGRYAQERHGRTEKGERITGSNERVRGSAAGIRGNNERSRRQIDTGDGMTCLRKVAPSHWFHISQ